MKYGIYLSNFGKAISARSLADLAEEAERAGWGGFFLWDQIHGSKSNRLPMVDPWVALTAMAMKTEHIRLGTTVTPLARRRPWKLARETVTLDHLSKGRLTLCVGLGDPPDAEFSHFGENADPRIRAKKLDEGLEVLTGLWSGKAFEFHGEHFSLDKTVFRPPAFQLPRIPIWVGGFWPNKAPFRRAARWDGAFPLKSGSKMTGKDLQEIQAYIEQHRESTGQFDMVMMGYTPGDDRQKATKIIRPFMNAGLTWWLEGLFRSKNSYSDMLSRIRHGPPAA